MPFVKVRGDGAITIPVEFRRKHSVTPGTWYQVSVTSKGKIVLSPKRTVCSLCGAEVLSVDAVTGTCPYCKTILTDMVRSGFDLSSALKHMQHQRKNGSF